jgi:formimidoylglutamase
MEAFNLTERPNKTLIHHSHDKNNDFRLGEIIKFDEGEISSCVIVILGCPQDEGVIRNNGRAGARKAPDKIREWLYKFNYSESVKKLGVFDIGNIKLGKTLEETHKNQNQVVKSLLELHKKIIILGGGNDISYPDCKALSEVTQNKDKILAFNIDKHFDVRTITQQKNEGETVIMTSGTPYAFLINKNNLEPKNFIEIGYIPFFNSENYTNYLKKIGVTLLSLDECREKGLKNLLNSKLQDEQIESIFWGFDMDAITSSDAPGVSSSYPIGFTAQEIISLAKIAGGEKRSKIFEFTEMNPDFDIDNRTVKLVAILVYTVILEMSY